VRISPAQFIHDREIGIREKQGIIINDDNDDEKEYSVG